MKKGINSAINHDGDTDSTGSITCNILGLILGEDAIPLRWRTNLNNYTEIKQVDLDLFDLDLFDAANNNSDSDWRRRFKE